MPISYSAKMNSYVHNHNYPITKKFWKKSLAITYIKRALRLYPYVKIKLASYDGKSFKFETWKMVKNKRGGLSPRKVKL